MTAPVCPCVACELDRERHRPQFRLRLDGRWYDPRIGHPLFTDEQHAPLVGPNHSAGRTERVPVLALP